MPLFDKFQPYQYTRSLNVVGNGTLLHFNKRKPAGPALSKDFRAIEY